MASFMLSPGVRVTETDLTAVTPAVSTSAGAFAGVFRWGPVQAPTLVSSEDELVRVFGSPVNGTATSFFSAANFLSYSNNLTVVRVDANLQRNAVSTQTGSLTGFTVEAGGSGYTQDAFVTISEPDVEGGIQATATVTVVEGAISNVVIVNAGTGYSVAPSVTINDLTGEGAVVSATVAASGIKILNEEDHLDNWSNGAGLVGEFAARYPGSRGNSIRVIMVDRASWDAWSATTAGQTYSAELLRKPDTDRDMHILVIDEKGLLTGNIGTVVEKFEFVSKASNGRYADGTSSYYKNVINARSRFIYWMDHPVGMDWGKEYTVGVTFTNLTAAVDSTLTGGTDDFAPTNADLIDGFDLFKNKDLYDISLVILGKANTTVAQNVIDNVVLYRKDCIAFISPEDVTTGEPIIGKATETANTIVEYASELGRNTSYAVMDSGYKYQYDKYNDVYRWIPLNADIAGLCARTDFTNDPWYSPGGFSRGQVKNVVKLAFNPDQTARDVLYKNNINPVVSFKGEGTLLYGDKTLQTTPTSAFDRINVRRLFLVLEKAISRAAKANLFEFNDEFTRQQFKSTVEPFLRDVQGRRGITDFRVKCDETNNTAEVIDSNSFVADIYIKPARSINFINLNFVATRTGINFEEIGA